VKRRSGSIIAAPDPGTIASLTHELAHRVQEVDVVAGEIVDPLESWQGRQFQSIVADQPSDNRPILLFDVAGVVLRVGSAARESDALVGAVANEQSVDELTSVVAIEPQDRLGRKISEASARSRWPERVFYTDAN
jgi:hypothetical protein